MENNNLITVQVSFHAESDKSYGCLVDLIFDENKKLIAASRLEWFPKKICKIQKIESKDNTKERSTYFLTAPEWILKSKKVNY